MQIDPCQAPQLRGCDEFFGCGLRCKGRERIAFVRKTLPTQPAALPELPLSKTLRRRLSVKLLPWSTSENLAIGEGDLSRIISPNTLDTGYDCRPPETNTRSPAPSSPNVARPLGNLSRSGTGTRVSE